MKRFSSFSLDPSNECIWRGEERVQLAPKAYAVLAYLIENPGRIVTKEELLNAVWPDTYVQESVLKTCVLDIRKALGENARDTKHIATVHRRGYRFVDEDPAPPPEPPHSETCETALIGRRADLTTLRRCWERALAGERQVVFVTGEPGIGKSTLIAHFLAKIGRNHTPRILRGQCIELFGASEACYAIFEALARAAKEDAVPGLVDVLRQFAPTWLVQMPGIAPAEDIQALRPQTMGATQERMLREMSVAIEAMADAEPLVLVIEDLHWCDVATLDLIAMIANRTGAARLLVLTSYRPVDAILAEHPVKSVKQSLLARGRCVEVAVQLLTHSETAEFLRLRFPKHRLPEHFADLVHARTDGNPLFVANVLDHAVCRSLIENVEGEWHLNAAAGGPDLHVPESLSKMIEAQVERLNPREQSILETASVVGMTFAVHLVAGDDHDDCRSCEACCDGLARRNLFICSAEDPAAPASKISAEYHFTHAIYREVLYRRMPPAGRIRLHRTIGERLERMNAERLTQVAGELAGHFQACRDSAKAVLYLRLLAQKCAARHALPDALHALNGAMDLSAALPDPGRAVAQFEITEQLGLVQRLMGQLTSSERAFEQMCHRARQMESLDGQLRAQLWLASVASFLDRDRCLQAADMALALCGPQIDADLRSNALGQIAYWNLLFRRWDARDLQASTDALAAARRCDDRAALALHANRHAYFLALSSWYREACATAREGVRIAMEIESLLDYSIGYYFQAWALLHVGEWGRMRTLLRDAIAGADRNGQSLWALLCGLLDAFLQVQAFSFASAQEACRGYLDRARELGHPLSVQISLVLLGFAEMGAAELARARRAFEELRAWQQRERILMDWIWKLPLQAGLTELCLAEGDVDAARREADEFLALASGTAECTWTALAHCARARVAMAERDAARAEREIAAGFTAIEGREAPLAEWRLHALAAAALGDASHRTRARSVIVKLAASFSDDDPLRKTLLARWDERSAHAAS